MNRLVIGLCCLLLVAACTDTPRRPAADTSAAATSAGRVLGQPNCRPASPFTGGAFPEVEGTSRRLQMWGWIMANVPLRVNEDVKIVWRITGSGPLHLATFGPDRRSHRMQWGPERHLSSNYTRPGQEWGAGYRFTQPGCWNLRATRGGASADVWLRIVDRSK